MLLILMYVRDIIVNRRGVRGVHVCGPWWPTVRAVLGHHRPLLTPATRGAVDQGAVPHFTCVCPSHMLCYQNDPFVVYVTKLHINRPNPSCRIDDSIKTWFQNAC